MEPQHVAYYMMQALFFPAVIVAVEVLRYVLDGPAYPLRSPGGMETLE
jgi:hypothetical protein